MISSTVKKKDQTPKTHLFLPPKYSEKKKIQSKKKQAHVVSLSLSVYSKRTVDLCFDRGMRCIVMPIITHSILFYGYYPDKRDLQNFSCLRSTDVQNCPCFVTEIFKNSSYCKSTLHVKQSFCNARLQLHLRVSAVALFFT